MQEWKRSLTEAGEVEVIGQKLFSRGEFANALTYLRRALQLKEEFFGKNHHKVANPLTNIGNIGSYIGDYVLAESSLKRALEILQPQRDRLFLVGGLCPGYIRVAAGEE